MKMMERLKRLLLLSLIGLVMISGAQAATTTTYYHTDALGSIVAATDDGGTLLWRKTYDPYGNEITVNQNGEELEEQTYTGKPYDPETGLLYLNQRYYDPQIRRFMGMDPVGFTPSNPASFNRYTYANNNPYKFVDPDGRFGVDVQSLQREALRRSAAGQSDSQIGSGFAREGLIGLGAGALVVGGIYGGAQCWAFGLCRLSLYGAGLGDFIANPDPLSVPIPGGTGFKFAAKGGSKALRPVGSLLESVDDVIANPSLLKGLNPAQLMSRINKSDNWVVGTMTRTRGADKGFTLRELNKRGSDFTDRYIQYHPGSRRHFGGQPYWKVSSGNGGTTRFPVNGGG